VHNGGVYGVRTGEGPSQSEAVKHKVRIFNHYADQVVDVEVPEDRWVARRCAVVPPRILGK
jgi:ferredoxin